MEITGRDVLDGADQEPGMGTPLAVDQEVPGFGAEGGDGVTDGPDGSWHADSRVRGGILRLTLERTLKLGDTP